MPFNLSRMQSVAHKMMVLNSWKYVPERQVLSGNNVVFFLKNTNHDMCVYMNFSRTVLFSVIVISHGGIKNIF